MQCYQGRRKKTTQQWLGSGCSDPKPPQQRKPSASGTSFSDWIGGTCYADTCFRPTGPPLVLQQLQQKEDSHRAENPVLDGLGGGSCEYSLSSWWKRTFEGMRGARCFTSFHSVLRISLAVLVVLCFLFVFGCLCFGCVVLPGKFFNPTHYSSS